MKWFFVIVLSLSCATEVSSPTEKTTEPSTQEGRCQPKASRIHFDSQPLGDVVKAIQQATCKNFIMSETIKKKNITLLLVDETAPEDLLKAFEKALSLNRLMLKEEDGVYTVQNVLPQRDTALSSASSPLGMVTSTEELSADLDITKFKEAFDSGAIATEARIVPSLKDGEFQGYKLFAIRPTSAAHALGLRNGDLVHSINGESLETTEKTQEIFSGAKAGVVWKVGILRKEQSVVLTITFK